MEQATGSLVWMRIEHSSETQRDREHWNLPLGDLTKLGDRNSPFCTWGNWEPVRIRILPNIIEWGKKCHDQMPSLPFLPHSRPDYGFGLHLNSFLCHLFEKWLVLIDVKTTYLYWKKIGTLNSNCMSWSIPVYYLSEWESKIHNACKNKKPTIQDFQNPFSFRSI